MQEKEKGRGGEKERRREGEVDRRIEDRRTEDRRKGRETQRHRDTVLHSVTIKIRIHYRVNPDNFNLINLSYINSVSTLEPSTRHSCTDTDSVSYDWNHRNGKVLLCMRRKVDVCLFRSENRLTPHKSTREFRQHSSDSQTILSQTKSIDRPPTWDSPPVYYWQILPIDRVVVHEHVCLLQVA